MERLGLVGRVEQELERMISEGQLPTDGFLPSEHSLARNYGVSRTTVREAMRQLAARGLVVQHPGRRTRAVALDAAVSLENLSVMLQGNDRSQPDRWRLIDGYFALKRETAVAVLAACCERASERDLQRLQDACVALREAARWEEKDSQWAELEFGLLRLAARAADLPGQELLLHSLERSFWGMAGRLLPLLDSAATAQWAQCTLHALGERDAQTLRRELPALLQAVDARVLKSLDPARAATLTPLTPPPDARPQPGSPPVSESTRRRLPEADGPNLSACQTVDLAEWVKAGMWHAYPQRRGAWG
jgi:GntR family transcriptional repressor for pyruvate dehydrogenase complex